LGGEGEFQVIMPPSLEGLIGPPESRGRGPPSLNPRLNAVGRRISRKKVSAGRYGTGKASLPKDSQKRKERKKIQGGGGVNAEKGQRKKKRSGRERDRKGKKGKFSRWGNIPADK